MTTFNLIVNKVINNQNNIFSYKYDNSDNTNRICKIFYGCLDDNIKNNVYKNKFDFYIKTIDNFYLSDKSVDRVEFINLFYKIQKIYHTLNRFFYNIKYKKSKLIVDTDLQLNTISQDSENILSIYHFNSRYLFRIDELLKIIYTSLTNCYNFFSEPLVIKNPYNNIPFGKSILYYIYFKLIFNTNIKFIKHDYIDLFLKFVKCNFNMTEFLDSYEYVLREHAITNFLKNSTNSILKHRIKNMINAFNVKVKKENKQIIIHDEFPDDLLIRIMKPYLYLELESFYSLVNKNKIESIRKLEKKLYEFQRFNPQFGRKIYKMKTIYTKSKVKRVKSHFEFITKHKKFESYDSEKFVKNHLSYNYDDFIIEDNETDDGENDFYDELLPQTQTNNLVFNQPTTLPFISNQDEEDEEEDEDYEEDYEEDDEEYYDNDSIS
jgi:hypothetical protein